MNSTVEPQTAEVTDYSNYSKESVNRRWRVGTLSMGLSLLFLGALIMASGWKGADVFETALAWWPVIFILLGLEVIIYTLWFRGKGRLYYDVLSIFFVGFLALCCLIFAGLSSLGLTREIRHVLTSPTHHYSLPEWTGSVPGEVKQVIVQGDYPYGVKVDQTAGTNLNVFGSYRSNSPLTPEEEDQLLRSKVAGDTLYILLGETPTSAFGYSGGGLDVTVAAPKGLKVIVRDNNGNKVF